MECASEVSDASERTDRRARGQVSPICMLGYSGPQCHGGGDDGDESHDGSDCYLCGDDGDENDGDVKAMMAMKVVTVRDR